MDLKKLINDKKDDVMDFVKDGDKVELVKKVADKLAKGKSPEEIAKELKENLSDIKDIIKKIKK